MNPLFAKVAARAGNRCEYCRAHQDVFNINLEVEHITPSSLGGGETDDNLALCCRACNLYKSNRVRSADPLDGTEVRLFHPRQDRWEEHFAFDAETVCTVGLTAVGRATISCLQMNSDAQIRARRQWIRLGLYP